MDRERVERRRDNRSVDGSGIGIGKWMVEFLWGWGRLSIQWKSWATSVMRRARRYRCPWMALLLSWSLPSPSSYHGVWGLAWLLLEVDMGWEIAVDVKKKVETANGGNTQDRQDNVVICGKETISYCSTSPSPYIYFNMNQYHVDFEAQLCAWRNKIISMR